MPANMPPLALVSGSSSTSSVFRAPTILSKSPLPPMRVLRFCTPCLESPAVSSRMKAFSSLGMLR